ncbi:amino acid adenylation domain-containing protein [Flavitalea sp.]|nr:amino acid adenylation domain-containing protein [Flavitalea sp.]
MTPGILQASSPVLVHQLVNTQITTNSTGIAIRFGPQQVTYQQLDQKAGRIAWLLNNNCPDEEIIGISTTRSIEMIVGVLGILRSGRAYLPLDPTYPPDRVSQIIKESAVKSCLASGKDHDVLKNTGLKMISSGNEENVAEYSARNSIGSGIPTLAYILYTSGSTGKPKGVSMGHAALVNLLDWQAKESKAGPGTNTLQFAPLSFDVSFQEIFSTLTTGGTLVLAGDDIRLDPFRLLALIKDEAINRVFLPFVALQQLAETAGTNNYFPGCLQEVITAGEQLKITPQLIKLFSGIPECKLFNQYGPTEAHVVTQLVLEGDPIHWPALPGIGSPVSNTQIFIIDEHKQLLEDGETGELIIGGICLAEGYLNQPALTAGKFIDWQHPRSGKMRVYLSGDLARYLPDGNIEFLGRSDDQVKIRGHRVEPGEIEVILNKYPDVEQAVVIARENKSGQKRLLAYLKPGKAEINLNAVRAYLESSLPQYMVPSAIMQVEQFPKTTSGKIDKKALPDLEIKRPDLDTIYIAPATDTEKKIAGVWAFLLEMDRTGTLDNFFELGGNSLLAVKTIVELREKYGLELPVTKLYSRPTIKDLAYFLDHGETLNQEKNIKQGPATYDIAVIGLAGRFPGAGNVEAFWQNLVDGNETTSFFSMEELDQSVPVELRNNPAYVKARGVLNDADMFDASFFGINPNVASLMDPQQRLFLEISWELLEQTGYLPAHFKGSIGVFAGSGNNTYYFNNVQSNTGLIDQVGAFQVMTANEKDYIATRTAFQLNLKGPAISLNTGCSTSLLAISQAVENIRSGRCDLAIAGGVAVTVPLKSGHLYEEGAMLSSDGHCRPFDAMAGGTVFSDGAGVVLLKKLNEAVTDGDTIYGIIKGIGVNNDGAAKSSFTAPSAAGQAAAIRQAIDEAGIDAAEIGYIEAHGTATPIGDPIEIEGLKMAFGEQTVKQYCAIGSVKSNMGHLTAAAGVAGFIKTVLALYHKQIPASINFNSSNPQIDFKNSPFYVNSDLRLWTTDKRVAGVSSFGVGGTNVHILIESADAGVIHSSDPKPAQLLQFSAKSVESIIGYADKLNDFLDRKKDISLQDVAFSLRSTRQPFNQRRFVVANDSKTAIDKLRSPAFPGEQVLNRNAFDSVAFVFPGQGSQFVNMGKELYQHEPIFREAVDECAYLLYEFMSEDIRTILFDDTTIKKVHHINNTRYTQPAMFIFEYALAKLWMNWGIKPSAFIGHSIGEFVAAHLSGIFSLGDAIRLIEARGRLMAELPQGSMISVLAGFEQVMTLIPAGLSVAAVNSRKMTVVAGPTEDIDFFSLKLNEAGIGNKKLVTSHAFHSHMMQPVKLPFEKLVGSLTINKPTIPIFSTVTGKLLSDSEAIDPAYWSNHLMATVRFADAVEELLSGTPTAFLEIGPRNVTTTLVKQQAGDRQVLAIASQHQEAGVHHAYAEILQAVGQLWANGISVDFSKLTNKTNSRRVDLPSYAFDKKKYWVENATAQAITGMHIRRNNNELLSPVQNRPASSGTYDGQSGTTRKSSLIIAIRKILEEATGFDMVDTPASTGFMEAGLDSLLLTQVALTLKKRFAVPVSFRQLNEECNTIEKLANYYIDKISPDAETSAQEIQEYNQVTSHAQPQTQFIQQQKFIQQRLLPQSPDQLANDQPLLNQILQQLQILAQQVALLQANQTLPQPGESSAKIAKHQSAALRSEASSNKDSDSYRIDNEPPVPGAKLGKDDIGNPAWFISNPAQPGGYLQIQKN